MAFHLSPRRRAFACTVAIALVVLAARVVLARFDLARADALALDALASAIVLALVACALAGFEREPLAARLGLGPSRIGGGAAVVATMGLVALSHAAEAAVALLGASSASLVRFDDALGGLALADAALPLFAIAIGSAVGEEIFFRGLVQRGLERRAGTALAIAMTSLLFGAAHGDLVHGAAAAALGAYLGVVAARADSIRPAIAAHAVNNAAALLQKAAGLALPQGTSAELATLVAGVTLAGVGLATLLRHSCRSAALQVPPKTAEGPPGA